MDKQEIDWGGPAFPVHYLLKAGEMDHEGKTFPDDMEIVCHGLTTREYIAIRAMQALIPIAEGYDMSDFARHRTVAELAVDYADALIKHLGEDDAE